MHIRSILSTIVMLAGLAGAASPALAAESYDGCVGFIDAVPAVITTQGTWCLRKDIATSMSGINAIEIQVSNVTIDCNGFKLGGSPPAQLPSARASTRTARYRTSRFDTARSEVSVRASPSTPTIPEPATWSKTTDWNRSPRRAST